MVVAAGLLGLEEHATAAGGEPALSKREERGQAVLTWLQDRIQLATNAAQRRAFERDVAEIRAALSNNAAAPVPPVVDVFGLPFVHYRYATARVGTGETPAANVAPDKRNDRSLNDPLPSSFWQRPTNINAQDLAAGFGRAQKPIFHEELWTYTGPKRSYGGHAGFDAASGRRRIKVKFGEVHSEPFTARIFHALGYNAEPVDYTPGIRIRYDRRLITEFNSRKPVNTKVTVLGLLPVWTIQFQPKHDPFRFITAAVLHDGTSVSGQELSSLLLREGQFDEAFEQRISWLQMAEANVQIRDEVQQNIGPWHFGQLDHAQRRELRGAGVLAAWLGWFDSRVDNTRLKVSKTDDGGYELKHYFADLGGGLGKATGMLNRKPERHEAFPEVFTRPVIRQGPHRMTIPFRVINFRPIERTPAFAEMTFDDARWMARRIAQLTEKQIRDALEASGFSPPECDAYARKLLARRDKMLLHLELR